MLQQQVIKITKALADHTRFNILQALASGQEVFVGELARDFPVAQGTVSQHLRILAEADLVTWRRGRSNKARIYYKMVREVFDEYQNAMTKSFDPIGREYFVYGKYAPLPGVPGL